MRTKKLLALVLSLVMLLSLLPMAAFAEGETGLRYRWANRNSDGYTVDYDAGLQSAVNTSKDNNPVLCFYWCENGEETLLNVSELSFDGALALYGETVDGQRSDTGEFVTVDVLGWGEFTISAKDRQGTSVTVNSDLPEVGFYSYQPPVGLYWRNAWGDGEGHWFQKPEWSMDSDMHSPYFDTRWGSFFWYDGEDYELVTADQLSVDREGLWLEGVDWDFNRVEEAEFVGVHLNALGDFNITADGHEDSPFHVRVNLPDGFYASENKTVENLLIDGNREINYAELKVESAYDPQIWWIGPANDACLTVGTALHNDYSRTQDMRELEASRLNVDREAIEWDDQENPIAYRYDSIGITLPDPADYGGGYYLAVYSPRDGWNNIYCDVFVYAPAVISGDATLYVNGNNRYSQDGENWSDRDELRDWVFQGHVTVIFTEMNGRINFDRCSFEDGLTVQTQEEGADVTVNFSQDCEIDGEITVAGEASDEFKENGDGNVSINGLNGGTVTMRRRGYVSGSADRPFTLNGLRFDATALGQDRGFGIGVGWEETDWNDQGPCAGTLTYYVNGENYWRDGNDGADENQVLRVTGTLTDRMLVDGITDLSGLSLGEGGELRLENQRDSLLQLGGNDLRVDGRCNFRNAWFTGTGTVKVDRNVYLQLWLNGAGPFDPTVDWDNDGEICIRLGVEDLDVTLENLSLSHAWNGQPAIGAERLRLERKDGSTYLMVDRREGESRDDLVLSISVNGGTLVYDTLSMGWDRPMSMSSFAERVASDFLGIGVDDYNYNYQQVFRGYPDPERSGIGGGALTRVALLTAYKGMTEDRDFNDNGWYFNDPWRRVMEYLGARRVLREVYRQCWKNEGVSSPDMDLFDRTVRLNYLEDDNWVTFGFYSELCDQLRGILPKDAVTETVTIILTDDGMETRYGDGHTEYGNVISGKRFDGTLNIRCEKTPGNHPEGERDYGGSVNFNACEFNGEIVAKFNADYDIELRFNESCSFGENCRVYSVGQAEGEFRLHYSGLLNINGTTVDTSEAGFYTNRENGERERENWSVAVMNMGDNNGGVAPVLSIDGGCRYDRFGYDTHVNPVVVSGPVEEVYQGLFVNGHVDVSGVWDNPFILQTDRGDPSTLRLGSHMVWVHGRVWGNQYYQAGEGAVIGVYDGNQNINVILLDENGDDWFRSERAEINRRGYNYQLEFNVQGRGYEDLSVRLYLNDEEIGPENYRLDDAWNGGFRLVPQDREDRFWPDKDEDASNLVAELEADGVTVQYHPMVFGPWRQVSIGEFVDSLLWAVSQNGYHVYDGSYMFYNDKGEFDPGFCPELSREQQLLLAGIWPDQADRDDGEITGFHWGGMIKDRLYLLFALEKSGLTPEQMAELYDDPGNDIRYDTAMAILRAVWTDCRGAGQELPESVKLMGWDDETEQQVPFEDDWTMNRDSKDELIWNRFESALRGVYDLSGLIRALEAAQTYTDGFNLSADSDDWKNLHDVNVNVAGNLSLSAEALAEYAESPVVTIHDDGKAELTVPAVACLGVMNGGVFTVGPDVILNVADGALPLDDQGNPVYRYFMMDWGFTVYQHLGTQVALNVGGTMVINGTLNMGSFRWMNMNGKLIVNGQVNLKDGEELAHGYLDYEPLRYEQRDWDDERGGDGWETIHTGSSINIMCDGSSGEGDGVMTVNGQFHIGAYSGINNDGGDVLLYGGMDVAHEGFIRNGIHGDYDWDGFTGWYYIGSIVVKASGELDLNGRLENNSMYEPQIRKNGGVARSLVRIEGTLTTANHEVVHEDDGAEINNDGEIEIAEGGRLILGAYDAIFNNAWFDYENGNRTAASLAVEEGGVLEMHAADLLNNSQDEMRAELRIDGTVTMDTMYTNPNIVGYSWVPTIQNRGGSVTVNGSLEWTTGSVTNSGTWQQNGRMKLGSETHDQLVEIKEGGEKVFESTVFGAGLVDYRNMGGELRFSETAAMEAVEDAVFRVYMEEENHYDDSINATLWHGNIEKPDLGKPGESIRTPALVGYVHTPGGLRAAAEKDFDMVVIQDSMLVQPGVGESELDLSFDYLQLAHMVDDEGDVMNNALTLGSGATLRANQFYVGDLLRMAGGKVFVKGTELTQGNEETLEDFHLIKNGDEALGRVEFLTTPLRTASDYARAERLATITVVADADLTLSGYELSLDWDEELFELTAIENAQTRAFGLFQSNTENGELRALSNNGNVTVAAGEALAVFTLRAKEPLEPGDYFFPLRVGKAVLENEERLPWAETGIQAVVQLLPLNAQSFEDRSYGKAKLNFADPEYGDFTLKSSGDPIVALYFNGEAYCPLEAKPYNESTYYFKLPADYDDSQKIVLAVKGDAYPDGASDILDAQRILKYVAYQMDPTELDRLINDVDNNGYLTVNDVVLVLMKLVELARFQW